MSNTENTAPVATENNVSFSPTKPRRPIVNALTFLAALRDGSNAEPKLTAAQVAEKLGMGKPSFDQRHNAVRKEWRLCGFVVSVLQGKSAAELGMSQKDFDEMLAEAKEQKLDTTLSAEDVVYLKPFPYTLADGRSNRTTEGKGNATVNALLAMMKEVG